MALDESRTSERDADVRAYLAWWRSERNSASLFHALAAAERKPRDKALYAGIAATEDEHARLWADRVVAAGGRLPPYRPSLRTRLLIGFATRFDPALVVGATARRERADAAAYVRSCPGRVDGIADEELANADLLHVHAQSDLAEYAKKLVLLLRRWVILIVGSVLFVTSVTLGRNVQLEGLFFGLAGGATTGAVIHYLVAKVLVPLPFGRIWCGWACWTAAVLDQLPFRQSRGWLPGGAGLWRTASFAASLGLVACLAAAGYAGGLYGASGVAWFVGGNLAYWTLGVVLAYRFEDNRAFCKYACPVSVLLRLTSRTALIKVAGDAEACAACAAKPCSNLCPMDVRIADYVASGQRVLSSECILCQQCVVVCPPNALRLTAELDVSRVDLLDIDEARRVASRPEPIVRTNARRP